jgi:esterase/lipase superfamily enzyme
MTRELFNLPASGLNRGMGVARWGHFGRPVILFPTGGADYLDVERFLLVRALEPLITAGRIKVYAVDSVCRQGWLADVPAAKKVALQVAYDRWLTVELFPFVQADCGGCEQRFVVAGASLGAYQAWTAAARHPDRIGVCVGMSGTYRMDRRLDGYWDEDWYFHDPYQFLANLGEGALLDRLRSVRFVLGLGERWENPDYTETAAAVLAERRIPTTVMRWRSPAGHDWPTWRTMLPAALDHTV